MCGVDDKQPQNLKDAKEKLEERLYNQPLIQEPKI